MLQKPKAQIQADTKSDIQFNLHRYKITLTVE